MSTIRIYEITTGKTFNMCNVDAKLSDADCVMLNVVPTHIFRRHWQSIVEFYVPLSRSCQLLLSHNYRVVGKNKDEERRNAEIFNWTSFVDYKEF